MEGKPFGHSVKVVARRRLAARGPLDIWNYEERIITVRRRGTRRTLERAAHLVRGFIRMESEIEAYSKEEWIRTFGNGSETGRFFISSKTA